MTDAPDARIVREIARTAISYAIRDNLVQAAMAEHDISTDNVYAWSEIYDRVLDTIAAGAQEPAEQAAGDGEAAAVPELTDELLRMLPVPIAAAVHQLKLKHDGQRRRAEGAERRQEELRTELRQTRRLAYRNGWDDRGQAVSNVLGSIAGPHTAEERAKDYAAPREAEATTRPHATDGKGAD